MWRGPAWLTVLRDLLCLILGVSGVIYEETSGKPDLSRLVFFALLIVAPGALALAWLGRTGSAPSSPPAEEPQPPLSSPSSEG